MNVSTMPFVPKEDPEGTHSSLKIFLMTILIRTFSRREPKRLLVPRVEKAKSLYFYILLHIFGKLIVHLVKFFKSFATEGIYNIISMLSHFIS